MLRRKLKAKNLEIFFFSEEEARNLSILERLNLLEERIQNLLNRVKEQIQLKEKTIVEVHHTIHLVEQKDQKK